MPQLSTEALCHDAAVTLLLAVERYIAVMTFMAPHRSLNRLSAAAARVRNMLIEADQ